MNATKMKSSLKTLLGFSAVLSLFSGLNAEACKYGTKVLNKAQGAVVLCYDKRLKGYLSRDCFIKGKHCGIRDVIQESRDKPITLTSRDIENSENPDAAACKRAHQKLRVLIDEEGVQETFCESKKDGTVAPLYMLRWRT